MRCLCHFLSVNLFFMHFTFAFWNHKGKLNSVVSAFICMKCAHWAYFFNWVSWIYFFIPPALFKTYVGLTIIGYITCCRWINYLGWLEIVFISLIIVKKIEMLYGILLLLYVARILLLCWLFNKCMICYINLPLLGRNYVEYSIIIIKFFIYLKKTFFICLNMFNFMIFFWNVFFFGIIGYFNDWFLISKNMQSVFFWFI